MKLGKDRFANNRSFWSLARFDFSRETQTKRDLCQMVWHQGSQCREFKVFVPQPCIFSCCGSRKGGILSFHLHFCDSEWLQPGPLKHLPVWTRFRCAGGVNLFICVCLCLCTPAVCWNRLHFPLHMSLWLHARLRGRASRGSLVPFPGSPDSKRHTLHWEIISEGGSGEELRKGRFAENNPNGQRSVTEGVFGSSSQTDGREGTGVWEG